MANLREDLASHSLGSKLVQVSDQWFAEAGNLINPNPPIHKPGVYVSTGAWYDGWETRRHNPKPFDFVVIRLGAAGTVAGVEVDTAFFNGNHAPEITVLGCHCALENPPSDDNWAGWRSIIPRKDCGPSMRQAWRVEMTESYTHVKLQMYPDGGIARFRIYGFVVPVFPDLGKQLDLAAMVNGGLAIQCSDQHFGKMSNLLLPGRGVDMGDGWETKRSRGPHQDYVVVKLGTKGVIEQIFVDTIHFKGNFPQKVNVFATCCENGREPDGIDHQWTEILPLEDCFADRLHEFSELKLLSIGQPYTHIKMVIIPDGGVKRLRVVGQRVVE